MLVSTIVSGCINDYVGQGRLLLISLTQSTFRFCQQDFNYRYTECSIMNSFKRISKMIEKKENSLIVKLEIKNKTLLFLLIESTFKILIF